MSTAFDNWPEDHARQFSTLLELRGWLVAKAGHYNVVLRLPLAGIPPEVAVALATGALRATKAVGFAAAQRGDLVVITPQSISFESMGPDEFGLLCDDVADVIWHEIGLNVAPVATADLVPA